MYIFIVLVFTIITTVLGEQCALNSGGVVVQQITNPLGIATGLYWNKNGNLMFVDEENTAICVINGKDGSLKCTKIPISDKVKAIFPVKRNDSLQIALTHNKMIYLYLEFDDKKNIINVTPTDIQVVESDLDYSLTAGLPDEKGRLWIDSSKINETINPNGKIYRVDNTEAVNMISDKFISSYGVGFSPNNKIYYHFDSSENVIYKFDFNLRAGTLSNPTVVFDIKTYGNYLHGIIGAFTVCEDNSLWITICGSGQILQYNWKEKKIIQEFEIPPTHPISITFGGNERDILFIGTRDYPGSTQTDGAVYAVTGHQTTGQLMFEVNLSK